jgi:hypothetical protein
MMYVAIGRQNGMELRAGASSGRAAPVAILQVMLQRVGPLGYYPRVLKGVFLTGCFVTGSSFLAFVFGRFVLGFSFLGPCLGGLFLDPFFLG